MDGKRDYQVEWVQYGQPRPYADSYWVGTLTFDSPAHIDRARETVDKIVGEGRVRLDSEPCESWAQPWYNDLKQINDRTWKFWVQRYYLD